MPSKCKSRNGLFFLQPCFIVLCFAVLVFIGPARSLGQENYCPKSISVKEIIDKAPDGWTVAQDKQAKNVLAAITFYDGPPEQEASLVYDKWIKHNSSAEGIWQFDPSSSIWISCRYASTSIVLQKQLPAKTSECTVTYDPKTTIDGDPEIQKIACH